MSRINEIEPIYSINGKFVPKSEAFIPVGDIGLMRGHAVFDFWVTYQHHRSLWLDAQLERLQHSAKTIGIRFPWSFGVLTEEISQLLKVNSTPDEKAIRVTLTGGVGPNSITQGENPTKIIAIDPHQPYPHEFYENGVGIITHEFKRYAPGAKTNSYIEAVQQLELARAQDAVEVVYYDKDQVYEGSTSNLVIVKGGKIITPTTDILHGITRRILLEKLDLPIEERDFTIEELLRADEAALVASNKLIMPIVRIDGQIVGNGGVGKMTKLAMDQLEAFTRN
jgi:branched-subunit amino acid aminotransferase/4-amino-4-deoxychorismate lyase